MLIFFEAAAAAEGSRDPCVFAVLWPNDGRLRVAQSTVPVESCVVHEPDTAVTFDLV